MRMPLENSLDVMAVLFSSSRLVYSSARKGTTTFRKYWAETLASNSLHTRRRTWTSARVRYLVMISKISTGSCAIGHVAMWTDGEATAAGGDGDGAGSGSLAMRPSKANADDKELEDAPVLRMLEDDAEEVMQEAAEVVAGCFLAVLAALLGGGAGPNALSNRCRPSSRSIENGVPNRGMVGLFGREQGDKQTNKLSTQKNK